MNDVSFILIVKNSVNTCVSAVIFSHSYARQPRAVIEGIRRDCSYIVADIHRHKVCTSVENGIIFRSGTCASRCIPVDSRQPRAAAEGPIAYARHTVSNGYARQPTAVFEGFFTYARHAVRNRYTRQPRAAAEGTPADARHAVSYGYAR